MMIRNVQEKDIPTLFYLMHAFAKFDDPDAQLTITQHQLKEAYFSKAPDLFALVVEVEHEVVGFLNYNFSISSFELKSCLWVEDVFILEEYRNKGVGQQLFEQVRQIASDKECVMVEWLVRRNNTKGIRFYEQLGAIVDPGTIYVKWPL